MGLTVVLLVGAGLLLKSFERLRSSDIGVPVDNVLTLRLGLPDARYHEDLHKIAFFESLIARVRALPGVSAAGLVSAAPGEGWNGDDLMSVVEHPPLPPGQGLDFMLRGADPGYFSAIGLPILEGRTFNQDERMERANVVLISRGAAQQYFPRGRPHRQASQETRWRRRLDGHWRGRRRALVYFSTAHAHAVLADLRERLQLRDDRGACAP